MPLNLTVSDGDFISYLKYNAKAGRFYIRPQGATQDVEVEKPRLLFDMANVKTGWLYYSEGAGPEKVWDPAPTVMAPRPPGPRKFKRGFEVLVFGGDDLPGIGKLGLREFSSTANNVLTSFLEMHAAYEAGMNANVGKIPFYRCVAVVPVQGAYGTNYEPKFQLMGWVEREKCRAFDEAMTSNGPSYDAPHSNGHDYQNGRSDDPFSDPRDQPPNRDSRSSGMGRGIELDDEIPF